MLVFPIPDPPNATTRHKTQAPPGRVTPIDIHFIDIMARKLCLIGKTYQDIPEPTIFEGF